MDIRRFLFAVALVTTVWSLAGCSQNEQSSAGDPQAAMQQVAAKEMNDMSDRKQPTKVQKTDEEWRALLTEEQFRVLRQCGTEPAFTGKYYDFKGVGTYLCAACGNELFDSETKYESGSGWPSFYQPVDSGSIDEDVDTSFGMSRVELKCSRCGSHLGHVFDDGPNPTGLRYCINSAALQFVGEGGEKGDSSAADSSDVDESK